MVHLSVTMYCNWSIDHAIDHSSIGLKRLTIHRVAKAQGKQGIWFLLFPDRENTGNFVVTQGKFLRHRENIFDCIYLHKKHVSLLHIFKIF